MPRYFDLSGEKVELHGGVAKAPPVLLMPSKWTEDRSMLWKNEHYRDCILLKKDETCVACRLKKRGLLLDDYTAAENHAQSNSNAPNH